MRPSFLLPLAATALLVSGCVGSTQPRADMSQISSLSGFDSVDVSAGVRVILSQGPFAVKAESSDGSFDRLVLHVRGNTLVASRNSEFMSFGGPDYTITVSAPSYRAFDVSSGARLDGGGLKMNDVKIGVSSGAHVALSGDCTGLDVDVSSGAHFDGEGLHCEAATVDASSGAHADAFAVQKASGNASSGGSVTIHGNPKSLEKDTSSGGSVTAL